MNHWMFNSIDSIFVGRLEVDAPQYRLNRIVGEGRAKEVSPEIFELRAAAGSVFAAATARRRALSPSGTNGARGPGPPLRRCVS